MKDPGHPGDQQEQYNINGPQLEAQEQITANRSIVSQLYKHEGSDFSHNTEKMYKIEQVTSSLSYDFSKMGSTLPSLTEILLLLVF
jgi:hypothetical protein